ncbi:MAG: Na+/H+ antiporter subunit B [Thermodesulfobacteriota bacterium]|nr:Na+/H+ antiporter subunit B [Thermodesulfobacteriota bacterium]
MQSLILRASTRLLVSLILVFSVYLLIRGHQAPGGGFSGALVGGTAFALYAIAEGAASVRQALRVDPRHLIVVGLLLALGAGLSGTIAGQPFLTGLWWTLTIGHDYQIVLGTPLFFDIGVYLIVLGTILTLILALEES